MPYTNDTKPTVSSTYLAAGSPIGLLLALTYAMGVGYSYDSKPTSSYSNDVKP